MYTPVSKIASQLLLTLDKLENKKEKKIKKGKKKYQTLPSPSSLLTSVPPSFSITPPFPPPPPPPTSTLSPSTPFPLPLPSPSPFPIPITPVSHPSFSKNVRNRTSSSAIVSWPISGSAKSAKAALRRHKLALTKNGSWPPRVPVGPPGARAWMMGNRYVPMNAPILPDAAATA